MVSVYYFIQEHSTMTLVCLNSTPPPLTKKEKRQRGNEKREGMIKVKDEEPQT